MSGKVHMMNQSGGGAMGGKASATRPAEPEPEATTAEVIPYYVQSQPNAQAHQAELLTDETATMPVTPYWQKT